MKIGYVYGNYLNFQINLDPGKTKSRYQAKWRSQIPVRLDLGFYLTVGEDEYWRIENTTESGESNFSVNVVHIDDLDFQIKSTREVDDFFWIYKAPVAIIGGRAPIGQDLSIRDTYVPVERNLNVANPNGDRFTAPVLVAKPVIIPTFVDFAPIRLELGYDYGAVGGPEFKTDIIETANGARWRNALHYLPLGRWQLGDRMVAESSEDKLEEVSYLKSFHEARRGSYQGFRYKDWADYYARNQYIATGDGVRAEFQLKKAYRAGDAVTYRPIQKPVFGTVELFVDGVNVAVDPDHEWEVNHDTGVISHPEPLPEGAVLSANFEFDVPVWFESDEIGFSLQAYKPESGDSIYRLESVFVVEGRIPFTLPWQMQDAVEITEPLELGIVYDTTEKHSFFTDKLTLANNFTRREVKREDTENIFSVGDLILRDREELDRLLGYFYCARGSSKQFPLIDKQQKYLSNWESDRLNIKFAATNNYGALFNLSNIKLRLQSITTLVDIPDLILWLDASDKSTLTLSGTEVINWTDKSGNNNHAIKYYGSPQLANNSISFNTISAFSVPVSFPNTNQARTIFVAFKSDVVSRSRYVFNFANNRFDLYVGFNSYAVVLGNSELTTVPFNNFNVWTIIELNYDSKTLRIYQNNVLEISIDCNIAPSNSLSFLGDIPQYSSSKLGFKGKIQQYVIVEGSLTRKQSATVFDKIVSKIPIN